jgi:hypothetical protein
MILIKRISKSKWAKKLITILNSTSSMLKDNTTSYQNNSDPLLSKIFKPQLKMTIFLTLLVDLRIAEMKIWENGLRLRRQDCFIIDLLASDQTKYYKYWERNVTWIMLSSQNKTLSGNNLKNKSHSEHSTREDSQQRQMSLLKFHLRMHLA